MQPISVSNDFIVTPERTATTHSSGAPTPEASLAPTVTVAIPTYNGTAFLAPAIESVLAQTLPNFELLIVDDHSSDDIDSVLALFDDPRIRVLRNDRNLGPEANWNRCLTEAGGKYFKLLPQDDTLTPDCLRAQASLLEADRDERLALTCCARSIIDGRHRVLMRRGALGNHARTVGAAEMIRRCLRAGTNVIGEPGSVLFRTSLARRVGAFSAEDPYVIDLDYWLRLMQHGDAYYLPAALATFRVSHRSWSVAIGRRQSADFNQLMRRLAPHAPFGAGYLDIMAGNVRARINAWLRIALYRLVLERRLS